jgi:hypothetical protein
MNNSAPEQPRATTPIPTLQYEAAADPASLRGPRPWWVYGIVALYLLLLAALLTFPGWSSWLSGDPSMIAPAAVTVGSMVACGLALMILPVRAMRRRTVRRRTIWVPIILSGFLAGTLVFGASLALYEYFKLSNDISWGLIAAGASTWCFWSVVFTLIALRRGPASIGMKLHRMLIAGSALELLIAVPTHVVVRRRPDCCAGIGTGIGLCLGIGVMFVSLGPSVLLLYHRRRKDIETPVKPIPVASPSPDSEGTDPSVTS